jgi:hypothetical protein
MFFTHKAACEVIATQTAQAGLGKRGVEVHAENCA